MAPEGPFAPDYLRELSQIVSADLVDAAVKTHAQCSIGLVRKSFWSASSAGWTRNAGLGISLGDDCVIEAGFYVTAGTKAQTTDGQTIKARELPGADNLLFRRNSVTEVVEVVKRDGSGITLNEALHAN